LLAGMLVVGVVWVGSEGTVPAAANPTLAARSGKIPGKDNKCFKPGPNNCRWEEKNNPPSR